jgi:hypothetical protein
MEGLNDRQRLEIFNAICKYSLNFEDTDLTGISKSIFTLIKPNLDANNKRYLNGTKGGEYGKKGGRPNNPKETPNITPNVTPKEEKENPKLTPNKDKDKDVNKDENENKDLDENIAIAFLKNLPDDEKKILKDKLNIKQPFMYQKSNGTQVSFARYLHEAFFDPINSPRIKNRFTNENHYWRTIAEFTDVQIVSENYKRYQSAGEIRKHFINWHTQKQNSNQ